jgi:hypothetical protein
VLSVVVVLLEEDVVVREELEYVDLLEVGRVVDVAVVP